MSSFAKELHEKIAQLPDDDLARMILNNSDQYIPEALTLALVEIEKRGISLENYSVTETLTEEKSAAEKILDTFKTGAKAATNPEGTATYSSAGIKVICPHCKNDNFIMQEAMLNTRGLTFLNLDWMNKSATILVCAFCGMVQWFTIAPKKD